MIRKASRSDITPHENTLASVETPDNSSVLNRSISHHEWLCYLNGQNGIREELQQEFQKAKYQESYDEIKL